MMRWLPFTLILGCPTPTPKLTWSSDRAISGIFETIDANGDGRIDHSEFVRTAYAAPDFTALDLDKNASLSPSEVLAALQQQDPVTFDNQLGRPPISVEKWRGSLQRTPEARARWESLQFLAIEVQTRHPGAAVPTPQMISTLSNDGGQAYETSLATLKATLAQSEAGGVRQ